MSNQISLIYGSKLLILTSLGQALAQLGRKDTLSPVESLFLLNDVAICVNYEQFTVGFVHPDKPYKHYSLSLSNELDYLSSTSKKILSEVKAILNPVD